MTPASKKKLIAEARSDARKYRLVAWFWRANVPPVVVSYFLVPRETWEAVMLVYLAAVSIIALVDTNDGKAEAAEAKAAGWENP